MKVLITGINGFVGQHLFKELKKENIKVTGIDTHKNSEFKTCDITNKEKVFETIQTINPTVIVHLAALSSVGKSWKDQELTTKINVDGTKNLINACNTLERKPKFIFISSSEVYEKSNDKLTEESPLNPTNPYAISKLKAEKIVKNYKNYLIFRSFNHTGPEQTKIFVCSDFAKQVASITLKKQSPKIHVGNIDVERDFSDVRDIIRAYVLAIKNDISGKTYNLCSGKKYKISWILNYLCSLQKQKIEIKIDQNKFRPIDKPILYGSYAKFNKDTDWKPKIQIEKTLKDLYEYWLEKLKNE